MNHPLLSEPSLAVTVKASFGLVALVAVLVAALVIIKVGVIARDRYVARGRRRLAPIFERYLRETGGLPPALLRARWPLRSVLQYVIIHRSFGESDAKLKRILDAYEALGFVEADKRRLRSPFWWVRAEGARCLGQMKCRGAKAELLHRLKDSVLEVRLLAAWSLGRLGDIDTLYPIIDALAKDSRVAAMRLSSTVFELGPHAVYPLITLLDSGDAAVRLLAVHLLGELQDKIVLPYLVSRATTDDDKEVRVAAYKALGTLADDGTKPLLIAGLRDPLWEIRAQAARGLGILRCQDAVEPLAGCLEDPEWWVRRNAGEALTKLAEGKAALLKIYRRTSSQMAKEIAAQWLDELESLPASV